MIRNCLKLSSVLLSSPYIASQTPGLRFGRFLSAGSVLLSKKPELSDLHYQDNLLNQPDFENENEISKPRSSPGNPREEVRPLYTEDEEDPWLWKKKVDEREKNRYSGKRREYESDEDTEGDEDEHEFSEEDEEDNDDSVKILSRPFYYKDLPPKSYILSKALASCKSNEISKRKGTTMIEGKKLTSFILKKGIQPYVIFFSSVNAISSLNLLDDVKLFKCPSADLKFWSTDKRSTIISIFRTSELLLRTPPEHAMPVTLVCDNIRSPTLIGNIIKLGAIVGCQRIIFTENCTSVWNRRALRLGLESYFQVPISIHQNWSEVAEVLANDYSLIYLKSTFNMGDKGDPTEDTRNDLPPVSLYSGNFWKKKRIALILRKPKISEDTEILELCKKFDGRQLIVPLPNFSHLGLLTVSSAAVFELRRLWDKKMGKQ